MRRIAFVALAFCFSCSSLRSGGDKFFEDPKASSTQGAPLAYRKAMDAYKVGRFDEALNGFETFLKDEPTSSYAQVAIFNSGRSLEGLNRFKEAAEKYRAVIETSSRRAPKLQALALYQISFAYEAMGDDAKTIAALRDADARKAFLPLSAATAELPARLASAYARSGNIETALQYYTQAESGIARLRNQSEKQLPDWLPETYFQMGRLAQGTLTWENLEERMRPIEKGQIYLLQAMEFNHPKWSQEALVELKRIYEQMAVALTSPPVKNDEDAILSQRDAQEIQWAMTENALALTRKLKAARAPKEKSTSPQIAEFYEWLSGTEKTFKSILSEPRLGSGLTPEAQQRKNKPRGKVIDPDTELEKDYMKNKSLPEKPAKDDPNL